MISSASDESDSDRIWNANLVTCNQAVISGGWPCSNVSELVTTTNTWPRPSSRCASASAIGISTRVGSSSRQLVAIFL